MAKIKSIIKLKGTIGGINFYQLNGETIGRKAGGGFNGDAIKTKDSMVRVRENGSEFKGCMQSVQFFKKGLQPFLCRFKDGTLHQRLVSLFTKLKNLDLVSARGSRTVFGGLQSTAGQDLLKSYLLTSGSRLDGVLHQKVLFDWGTGFSIPDFEGKRVSFPAGATHLSLQVGYLTLDFENQASTFGCSDTVYLSPTDVGTVVLPAPALADAEGVPIGVVFAQFVQEMNGAFYPLKNENSVVLEVVSCRL
ncbi:hypothetical protein [Flavobacterium limnophilum]|uniref:hypothetical protein n=1 Tax=Flavobacterium limnophilum TaxID=3003262 RepID=UPI0024827505|nr:hypothetical protein [Flavobacterium limnophilum]